MTSLEDGGPIQQDGDGETEDPTLPAEVAVSAHRSAPGRTVFVEEDNNDGWIASDLTVDLER